jgi:TPR repeat protein
LSMAVEYFEMARNQGNADAAYNLAMMKLGWKTHFTTWRDLQPQGQSSNTVKAADLFPLSTGTEKETDDSIAPSSKKKPDPGDTTARQTHPTAEEYKSILTDLTTAASKNHLLARHRLAMLYESGIVLPVINPLSKTQTKSLSAAVGAKPLAYKTVLAPDCAKAVQHYQWIMEHASPTRASRMRRAYQQYIRGETASALRTYLLVAETGHDIAQLNAAFLLEQGECLGLRPHDCAKASVRLYKAVADKGNAEASMRVGDFYYYGRFRTDRTGAVVVGGGADVGPYGWTRYVIYPDLYLWPLLWSEIKRQIIQFSVWEPLSMLDMTLPFQRRPAKNQQETKTDAIVQTSDDLVCESGIEGSESEGSCGSIPRSKSEKNDSDHSKYNMDEDLAMAAHYYQLAAERTTSPRAHYNLGFMYEWGLGLKQDFPLAKRQYDLAITASMQTQEAYVPVSIALMVLNVHEYAVKLWLSWNQYYQQHIVTSTTEHEAISGRTTSYPALTDNESVDGGGTSAAAMHAHGEPSGSTRHGSKKTTADVILSHLLSWESLLILVLTVIFSKLLQLRRTRR